MGSIDLQGVCAFINRVAGFEIGVWEAGKQTGI